MPRLLLVYPHRRRLRTMRGSLGAMRQSLRTVRRRAMPCVLLGSALAMAHAQDQDQLRAGATLPEAPSTLLKAGRLVGSVVDTNGDPVAGALVSVTAGSSAAASPATTDAEGQFSFPSLPPGPFTVVVTLAGFAPSTATGTLQPGAGETVPPIPLRLAVATTVDAVDAHELAAEQIHIEEQQKLIGILPNFFVSYEWFTPALSPGQKFHLAWRNAIDPGSFFATGVTAGIQQATNSFPGYGQGLAGFGRRYGADYGDLVSGTFLGGAILPTLFRQDPRYFYKGTGSIRSRILYAITRPVVARGDNGKWQPAYAGVLGDLSSGAVSNLYYDASDRHGAQLTLENGFIGIGGDAINDIFQEFLLKRFTPKSKNLPTTAP